VNLIVGFLRRFSLFSCHRQALRTRDKIADNKRVLKVTQESLQSPLKQSTQSSGGGGGADMQSASTTDNDNDDNNLFESAASLDNSEPLDQSIEDALAFNDNEQMAYGGSVDNAYRIVYQVKTKTFCFIVFIF
jgi:hypothetical protein